ncbi:hypothetical protein C5N14_04605 [Micromonospora sp. MW-13]|uniref:DUF4350 domain-containing protein n=1 Tax=Micromonospora sp. MW-13 TaxID=2094022 RepID=UPI000EE25676|nr:DUF4350 domain-containing protein [Micromonospora sp. MW-13]RGC69687.1 hypothetical protein C5N14_04605 [Micromonospora sp. MW-13]
MTAAPYHTGPADAAPAPPASAAAPRRWHRLAIPLGLAALLITITVLTHAVDQPDPTEPGFLSPVATDADGGSRLAAALRDRGVVVQRETDPLRAVLATAGRATLFVPAPGLLHPDTLGALRDLPGRIRLVLVDPPRQVLEATGLPLVPAGRRWATRAVGPDADGRPCALPEVARAGVAAAERQRYAVPPDRSGATVDRCYAAGLARVPWATETVVIGASDPFRNDRIGERGNRELATGLLGTTGRVVWLDLDGPAPPPPDPGGTDGPSRPANPEGPGGGTGDDEPGTPGEDRGDEGAAADGPSPPNPLWAAFPAWFWALLAQLALAALLLVLWRARRLGPPVSEPLPVAVRSAETVLGRARLYQRARARGPAADTLRAAALARLLPRLNLPADPPADAVAAAVAARAGGTAAQVHDLLYGDEPSSDRELLDLARSLDRLTRTVAGTPDPAPADAGPHRHPPAHAGGRPPGPADAGPPADPPGPDRPAAVPRPRPAPPKEDPR